MEPIHEVLQPLDLSEFKNLGPNMPTTEIDIPEKMENRVPTDRPFVFIFGACIALLIPFLIYTLVYSDIRRLRGTDDCGNVCGGTNSKYDKWDCTGQDFTDKKFLKTQTDLDKLDSANNIFAAVETTCVKECGADYTEVEGRCVSTFRPEEHEHHEIKGLGMYLSRGSVIFRLILCSLITVGVSVGVLYLFRYAMNIVVWSIIIGVFILCVIFVGLLWADYSKEKKAHAVMKDGSTLTLCLIGTLFLLIYLAAVYFFRNKIRLVILLLIEATKAVFAIPTLLIVPTCAFLAEGIIFTLFLTTTIYMATAGELVELLPGKLFYIKTDTMVTTLYFNAIITIWIIYFICGLQYMIIGGAVSEWYFAKDKTCLVQPVKRSATIAYKFHLGTIAFGALVITIAEIIRYIIKSMFRSSWIRRCVEACLRSVEELLNFITLRAYIVTAMHGQPFLKSGKRAAKLIVQNLCNITAVNFITRLTLGVAKLLIALVSVLLSMLLFLGEEEEYVTAVLIIVFLLALLVGTTFVALFETTIDTLFICFCEDSILNDGMARPYAMSKDLMEFVENSKKVYGETQTYVQFDPAVSQAV